MPRPEVRRAVWANALLVAGYALVPYQTSITYIDCYFRINSLVDILKHNPTPQMSYQVGFCLWLLTFEQEVSEQIQKCVLRIHKYVLLDVLTCFEHRRFDIIPLLVDVAQGAAKEKVIRVIVATFRVCRIIRLPLLRSSTSADIEFGFQSAASEPSRDACSTALAVREEPVWTQVDR